MVELNPRYRELTEAVFAWVKQPGNRAIASTIVVAELLVPFYKNPADRGRAAGALLLLAQYPNLEWVDTDFGIANRAAELRARYGLKTPDALHAATAIDAGATGFITNDAGYGRVQEFETLQFEKLL
jgi:predicted nucleic acid-binding protein